MDKTLVVVESPAKAKTIKKYLGPGFEVKASVGHIKDLPKTAPKERKSSGRKGKGASDDGSVLGVDVANGFAPRYEIIPGKEKVIKELREAAKKASRVLLATDPDREGEAIAWHVSEEIGKPKEAVYRVLFNELTERTIKEAVASPRRLDENKYNAQQARRILDRIVGYRLSPLLWQKVQSGLSAGRVQSVALRLIVRRQNAIETFVPQEYWSITALLESEEPPPFEAKLVADATGKVKIPHAGMAEELVNRARESVFEVMEVKRRERSRKPVPPFITSTLQQEASRKLRMASSRTMRIAQQLYEGIELGEKGSVGLITYMRTDSPRVAPEALTAVREYIGEKYGAAYLPDQPNLYKSRKSAQEAHEAIRPTSMELSPDRVRKFLDKGQYNLYKLIWDRFVASQMTPAVFDLTTANIRCDDLTFRVTGSVMKFDGFLKVYSTDESEREKDEGEGDDRNRRLPHLEKGQRLALKEIVPRQHFTQPPPPYNEASLIKELEELGIGRPSTYADIVSTIQRRKYVEMEDKRFRPTLLGRIISNLLLESFPQLLDEGFTAQMESSLDRIEEGAASWKETLESFYGPFSSSLAEADKKMRNIKRDGLATGLACPECGEELLLRSGRYGLFLGCSGYPECDFTSNVGKAASSAKEPIPTDEICPECGAGMVIRESRTGAFLSCSRYPECKAAKPLSTGVTCPQCGKGEFVQRRARRTGKVFYSCSRYPDCDNSLWNKPVARSCPNPDCDSPILEERIDKEGRPFYRCPKCKKKAPDEPQPAEQDKAGAKAAES